MTRLTNQKDFASTEEWFWNSVDKSSDCWEWKGAKHKDGYGYFWLDGKQVLAHRYAMQLNHTLMTGDNVLHKCDNPPCVLPDHLFIGSQFDNIRDMDKKRRRGSTPGVLNRKAKLTEMDVKEIRKLAGVLTQVELAKLFQVTQATISSILLRKTWTHV